MEKITKKEFRTLLEEKQNCLVASGFAKKSQIEDLDKYLDTFQLEEYHEFRTAKYVRSNSIEFSNGSSIYFDEAGEKRYYKKNDFIISETVTLSDFGSVKEISYGYIVYFIK